MAKPEAKVKLKIKSILKAHNVYYFMPVGGMYGRAGVPDFICCVQGKFLGIEAKAGSKKPSPLQNVEHARIRKAGGSVLVVNEDNINDILAMLSSMAMESMAMSSET